MTLKNLLSIGLDTVLTDEAAATRVCTESTEWPTAQIHAALHEADSGDFASEAEVAGLAAKWQIEARSTSARSASQPEAGSQPLCS